MTMSQDVWRTLCTKVDDLKLTNARGNKIRGTMMPPIFSMGCSRSFQSSTIKERDCSDHRHKAREPPSIPTLQAKQEPWRHTIGAMLLTGESMVMTLKPRMYNKMLRRPQDQDHDIFGSIRKKSLLSSIFCSTSEANSTIFLDIQKLHEVPIPTNQEPSQSEIPTSGYGQNIEGCAL